MFRFIHAADLHLDSPLRGLERYEGAPVARIRDATRRAVENLVQLAIDERVAFVALAGDIYDGDWPDYATGLFFARQMGRLKQAGIAVFLIRGNHDAASHMTRSLTLPDNVRVFVEDQATTAHLPELRVAIHGQSFADRETRANLAVAYPPPVAGHFNLALLHTSLQGEHGHDTYAPCSADQLAQKGYDYWALGHIHQPRVIQQRGPTIAFAGNTQGRHVREVGRRGCYLVTVDQGKVVRHDPRDLDVVRWQVLAIDASGANELAALPERIQGELDSARQLAGDRLLAVRLRVSGATAAHAALAGDAEAFLQQCRANALAELGESVWIESLRLETRPLDAGTAGEALNDDALAELENVIEELRGDDASLVKLLADLKKLDDKLPPGLREGEPLRLTDPAFCRGLLDRVMPLLARHGKEA